MPAQLPRRTLLGALLAAPAAAPFVARAQDRDRRPRPRATAGLFTGGSWSNNPAPLPRRVETFDDWLYAGRGKTTVFIDFAAHDTWERASGSLDLVNHWQRLCPPGQLALAWPLVTAEKPGAAGFAEIVAGGRDRLLERLCRELAERKMGNTIMRVGWEMNGDWYPWNAAKDPEGFVEAFRHVVTFCRNQPGVEFSWCWNPSITKQQISWEDCYPGNRFVDLVGIDIYDMWWGDPATTPQSERWNKALNGPFGLKDIARFARRMDKPLVIPEWGTGRAGPIGGGIENPDWIDFMADFITEPENNVAWHAYWNRDKGSGYESQIFPPDLRPRTAARYKARFGV
jgi:hypothetical protein